MARVPALHSPCVSRAVPSSPNDKRPRPTRNEALPPDLLSPAPPLLPMPMHRSSLYTRGAPFMGSVWESSMRGAWSGRGGDGPIATLPRKIPNASQQP